MLRALLLALLGGAVLLVPSAAAEPLPEHVCVSPPEVSFERCHEKQEEPAYCDLTGGCAEVEHCRSLGLPVGGKTTVCVKVFVPERPVVSPPDVRKLLPI